MSLNGRRLSFETNDSVLTFQLHHDTLFLCFWQVSRFTLANINSGFNGSPIIYIMCQPEALLALNSSFIVWLFFCGQVFTRSVEALCQTRVSRCPARLLEAPRKSAAGLDLWITAPHTGGRLKLTVQTLLRERWTNTTEDPFLLVLHLTHLFVHLHN